jgi:putative DNA primase/helicase
MDRAIVLQLRRKKMEEQTERLRHADPLHFKILAAKLARFSADYSSFIKNEKPNLPDALHDRAQDNWEPLFAIAYCANESWRQLVQVAALKISGNIDQSKSMSIELLSDIREIIGSQQMDRITTADLIIALCWGAFQFYR